MQKHKQNGMTQCTFKTLILRGYARFVSKALHVLIDEAHGKLRNLGMPMMANVRDVLASMRHWEWATPSPTRRI